MHDQSMKIHQNNPILFHHKSLMQCTFRARSMSGQTCGTKRVFHRYACSIPYLPGNHCKYLSIGRRRSTVGRPIDREHLGRVLAKRMRFLNQADSVTASPKSLLSDLSGNHGRNQRCEYLHRKPKCGFALVPNGLV